MIKPDFSASWMNSPGNSSPRVGWRQRTSASALQTVPLSLSTRGWKKTSSSPRVSARRSSTKSWASLFTSALRV